LINPRCSELDLIEELNLILRDERLKREKEVAQSKDKSVKSTVNPEIEEEDAEKVQEKKPVKKMLKNFILSSIVVIDKDTKRSKQFAFVDFSSAEAAQLCIKTWNNSSMKKYPNRLMLTPFDQKHTKMTK
jgi:hypothetical protein